MSFPTNPSQKQFAITPSDTAWLTPPYPKSVYVGGTGHLVVTPIDQNTDVTYNNVQQGTTLEIVVKKVKSSGTTATGIVGLR
jgi:hypothetical protein